MINLMECSGKKLREYGFEMEEKHEYEICRFSTKNIYSFTIILHHFINKQYLASFNFFFSINYHLFK